MYSFVASDSTGVRGLGSSRREQRERRTSCFSKCISRKKNDWLTHWNSQDWAPMTLKNVDMDVSLRSDVGVEYFVHQPESWWVERVVFRDFDGDEEDTALKGSSILFKPW